MAGASAGRGIPEAAVLSLEAGATCSASGRRSRPRWSERSSDAIVAAVGDGRLTRERLEDAARRVAGMRVARRRNAETPTPPQAGAAAPRPGRGRAARPGRCRGGERRHRRQHRDRRGPVGPRGDASTGSLAAGCRGSRRPPVVLQVRDAHRRPEIWPPARARDGRPAVVVEWGWPGPYDGGRRGSARVGTPPRGRRRDGTVEEEGMER